MISVIVGVFRIHCVSGTISFVEKLCTSGCSSVIYAFSSGNELY